LTGTGSFQLTFTGEEYAILPAGMISSLTDATFEVWVIWDGQLAATYHPRLFDFGSNAGQPGEQGAPTGWLGRSPVVADSHFGGEIDEFRIYAGLLPEATIVAHAAAGPDAP
jgi:hypothetical protein